MGALKVWNKATGKWEYVGGLGSPYPCTSTTRPTGVSLGQEIYETDTGFQQLWDGTQWQKIGIASGKRHRVRVQRAITAMLQATAGTLTEIIWDTILENTTGASPVNMSTGDITIQRDGWYTLQFTGNWQGAASATVHAVAINVNGTIVAAAPPTNSTSTANIWMNTFISKKVPLVAGDVVSVSFQSTTANAGFEAATASGTTSPTQFDVIEEL